MVDRDDNEAMSTVLVVDDEPIVRDIVVRYLEQASAAGTGIVISGSGLVMTNNHVIRGATSIRVRVVTTGKSYTAKGCVKADAMVVEHLEAKPATYWVFVDTKGHPGELRGKLFAGMAHM